MSWKIGTILKLYPTQENYYFSAEGPESNSWWNEINTWVWEVKDSSGIVLSTNTTSTTSKKYRFDKSLNEEAVYTLSVRGKDTAGNLTDPTIINIEVKKTIDGSTGGGGFTEKQKLEITTTEFLNAYPRELNLTVYLGNSGHNYKNDYIKIYGIDDKGNSEQIVYKKISVLAGQDRGIVINKESTVNNIRCICNISNKGKYVYNYDENEKEFDNVIKINFEFKNLNPNNKYKKIKFIYYNDHKNCVLNISDSIGGAYEYSLTLGT